MIATRKAPALAPSLPEFYKAFTEGGEKMFYIYMHISPSGKKYIGQTCQKLNRRWRNGIGYKKNPYFWRAIEKHGWDSFEHKIVFQCESLEQANRMEEWLIACHRSNDPKYGYNISAGADGKGSVAESTKKLLRENHKGFFQGADNPCYGRQHTEAERKKISEANKHYFAIHGHGTRYGHKASDETKAKLSEARKNSAAVQTHILKMNKAKAKQVLCVETNEVYESTHEVTRKKGFSQGNIAKACRESGKAYGLTWRYV